MWHTMVYQVTDLFVYGEFMDRENYAVGVVVDVRSCNGMYLAVRYVQPAVE